MTKYLVAPLLAVTVLTGSGFLDALERTVEKSAVLSASSAEAPASTAAAARDVGSLPAIARLTERQAEGLQALADALEVSAERVGTLDGALSDQLDGLDAVIGDLTDFAPLMDCARTRLRALLRAASPVPDRVGALTGILGRLIDAQEKSIRHLRSINRKLAALGVVAQAEGVEPPSGPGGAGEIEPGSPPEGEDC